MGQDELLQGHPLPVSLFSNAHASCVFSPTFILLYIFIPIFILIMFPFGFFLKCIPSQLISFFNSYFIPIQSACIVFLVFRTSSHTKLISNYKLNLIILSIQYAFNSIFSFHFLPNESKLYLSLLPFHSAMYLISHSIWFHGFFNCRHLNENMDFQRQIKPFLRSFQSLFHSSFNFYIDSLINLPSDQIFFSPSHPIPLIPLVLCSHFFFILFRSFL